VEVIEAGGDEAVDGPHSEDSRRVVIADRGERRAGGAQVSEGSDRAPGMDLLGEGGDELGVCHTHSVAPTALRWQQNFGQNEAHDCGFRTS
jgi:hypothetical protein